MQWTTPYSCETTAEVGVDNCIEVEGNTYSVPHQFVGKRVDVHLTPYNIEIFYRGTQISCHPRLWGTNKRLEDFAHLPEYLVDDTHPVTDGEMLEWASTIGGNVHKLIKRLLSSGIDEEERRRTCLSILNLSNFRFHDIMDSAAGLAISNNVLSREGFLKILNSITLPEPF